MREVILLVSLLSSQFGVPRINKPEHPQTELQTLPEQRKPDAATLKADYAKSVADAGELLKLSQELKLAMEQGDYQALPANAVRMLEEIEKRAKGARRRLKR